MRVDLPAGSGMRLRQESEHLLEGLDASLELRASPRRRRLGHVILPSHMIVGVKADLKAGVAHAAHHPACASPYVGTGQQHTVQQGLQTIVLEHRGARDLLSKTLAK